jgi:hypothetical protein
VARSRRRNPSLAFNGRSEIRLHGVYRATGKPNAKPRPPGFSKLRSLESFLRTWEACPDTGELVFQTDGAIPDDQLSLMRAAGQVIPKVGLDMMSSYWSAVRFALDSGWPDHELVYFGEDDYLYRPEMFAAIVAAAERLPGADHFAPYATIGHIGSNGDQLHAGLRRPPLRGEPLADIGGVMWHRATSHTLSYAVRLGALRADQRLHNLALRCSGAFDHAICLACQGVLPYGPLELLEPLHAPTGASPSRRVKVATWRVVLSAAGLARRRQPRLLAAPRPAQATHMELGLLASGTDWMNT